MKRILLAILAFACASPAYGAAVAPLTIVNGQVQRVQAGTTVAMPTPTTANASINLPHGTAPATPNNGDIWTTTGGIYAQINGQTAGLRSKLPSSLNLYVSPTGSDSNNCLSSGTACLTPNHAIAIAQSYDFNGQYVAINLADGTYTGGIACNQPWTGDNGNGIIINGDAGTPTNVVISTTSTAAIQILNFCTMQINNLRVTSTTYDGFYVAVGGRAFISGIDFGSVGGMHLNVFQSGFVEFTGNHTISGGAIAHYHAAQSGFISDNGHTVTITGGTPTFSSFFAGVAGPGTLQVIGTTYVGSAYGPAFLVHNAGFIDEGNIGCPIGYFPGSVGGTADPNTFGTCDYSMPLGYQEVNGAPLISAWQVLVGTNQVIRMTATSGSAEIDATNSAQSAFAPLNLGGSLVNVGTPSVRTPININGTVTLLDRIRPAQIIAMQLGTLDPSPVVGDEYVVTDASACTINTAVTSGGGTTHSCDVKWNGTGWIALFTH